MNKSSLNTLQLLIGTNLGNREEKLAEATMHLEANFGPTVKRSHIYQTAPWGNDNQPVFLNQVLIIETRLEAETCMKKILLIENTMGRVRTVKNAARIIDIDILFYNSEIIRIESLIVPHPEIQNRRFVLVPLAEISGLFIHPVFNKTVNRLLENCSDSLAVNRY